MTTATRKARRPRPRGARRREEGAALLVVMLILLMVTATATFAIHSTATEVRAAGNARMAMQSSYLGETALLAAMDWVDAQGPRVLVDMLAAREADEEQLVMAPFEPPLAENTYAFRIALEDLGGARIAPDTMFGTRSAYAPLAVVDIYDVHVYTGVVAGYSATGGSPMRHVRATYTARSRARIDDASISADHQLLHESAGDARAIGISGPFGM